MGAAPDMRKLRPEEVLCQDAGEKGRLGQGYLSVAGEDARGSAIDTSELPVLDHRYAVAGGEGAAQAMRAFARGAGSRAGAEGTDASGSSSNLGRAFRCRSPMGHAQILMSRAHTEKRGAGSATFRGSGCRPASLAPTDRVCDVGD
jgi:hypothetical protein